MSDSTGRSKKETVPSAKGIAPPDLALLSEVSGPQRETENEACADGVLANMEYGNEPGSHLETSAGDGIPESADKDRESLEATANAAQVSTGAGRPPPTGASITVKIDYRQIPPEKHFGTKSTLDTRDLAADRSDEEILLGLVAHPNDLHGTLFLRLAENMPNGELADRINALYNALKLPESSPNNYTHRLVNALQAQKDKHGWSEAETDREKNRIISKRKAQRPREWIYDVPLRKPGEEAKPRQGWTQNNPRTYLRKTATAAETESKKPANKQTAVQASVLDISRPSSPLVEDSVQSDDDPTDEWMNSDEPDDEIVKGKPTFKELVKMKCRKWPKRNVTIKSFTGVEWSTPTFQAVSPDQGRPAKVPSGDREKKSASASGKTVMAENDATCSSNGAQEKVVETVGAAGDLTQEEEDSGKAS